MVEMCKWEVHLSYDPMETSRSGEESVSVVTETKEQAINKAKEKVGMESANAYPVYRLQPVDGEQCDEQVLGGQCDKPTGHDGPCSRQEHGDERVFGQ